ncbi:MAG: serine/threonine-protein kinase [Desulfobacteraceae bacterium]|jgi:serine/threonine protein kinase|nr:serine/threonine-protein kinase [Desulfobacteraceae bacterium]
MKSSIAQEDLRQMAARWFPLSQGSHRFRIHTDTTDFFRVEYGDVVILGGRPYLIRHNAKEGRFGVDDEIKFWVKRAIDLESGSLKIIKLVFYEAFKARIGGIEFECFRSPKKEARTLKKVAGHKNFMHGYSIEDEEGNLIRVLDYIFGKSLHAYIDGLQIDHQSYFYNLFPGILSNFVESIEAIRLLHQHGEKHGDIRRDHILIDRNSGRYRWIDFDFNYRHRENIYGYDLFGLGNILIFLAGRGDVLLRELNKQNHPALFTLGKEDVNIVFNNRIANLKKVYPYIPESLNRVLMHFSKGANLFYENTEQLLDDLGEFQTLSRTIP